MKQEVVYKKGSMNIETVLKNGKSLWGDKTKDNYIKDGFLIGTMEEALKEIDKNKEEYYFSRFHVLTRGEYMDYIEQLPPHRWFTFKNVTFYDCLEPDSSDYRMSWVKNKENHYQISVSDSETDEERTIRFSKLLKEVTE